MSDLAKGVLKRGDKAAAVAKSAKEAVESADDTTSYLRILDDAIAKNPELAGDNPKTQQAVLGN